MKNVRLLGSGGVLERADERNGSERSPGVPAQGAETPDGDERVTGPPGGEGGAEWRGNEQQLAPLSRHIDHTTALLARYAQTWLDLQQTRKAMAQRELPQPIVDEFVRLEQKMSRLLTNTLRKHALWPWLSQFPGLGGAHTAFIIGKIGDPRRYPGQRCSGGHYLPPLYAVGSRCPITEKMSVSDLENGAGAELSPLDPVRTVQILANDTGAELTSSMNPLGSTNGLAECPGVMLAPRTTTGVRSLWRWLGLDAVDDGDGYPRAPRKRKGVKGYWDPRARASVMQPGGLAEHIVRQGVRVDKDTGERVALHRYAQRYLDARAQLNLRVAEHPAESVQASGDTHLPADIPNENVILNGGENGRTAESERENDLERGRPLRPFEADRIARKIAAKAFLGDLLVEWKRLT